MLPGPLRQDPLHRIPESDPLSEFLPREIAHRGVLFKSIPWPFSEPDGSSEFLESLSASAVPKHFEPPRLLKGWPCMSGMEEGPGNKRDPPAVAREVGERDADFLHQTISLLVTTSSRGAEFPGWSRGV